MSKNTGFVFRRPALALNIADGLVGSGIQDYSSGLFLAAPRRTGKSTFLREDLLPECQSRGWLAVYVDLWANREKDPAELIAAAIAGALVPFEKGIRKLAKSLGVEKLSFLRTLSWDFSKSQLPEGATLTQALELLHSAAGKTVVLIIDEAQHALSSEAGLNAMFALKAARDQLNQGRDMDTSGLRLVFTGSNRDKLAHLVLNRNQPFFGSNITPFPLLGRDFTKAYTAHLNAHLAPTNQFNADDLDQAFEWVGRRPEMLRSIIGQVALELGEASQLNELLRSSAEILRAGVWSEFESAWNGLTLSQRAVLEVMVERSRNNLPFAPFTDDTLAAVAKALQAMGSDTQPGTQTVQACIDALREKELVWKSSRGAYALEDNSFADWLQHYRRQL
ncbi:ATP-binding protein [Pseudomonas sp. TNT2022 ID357]|uniref:ATP-binding protein n=1 Tax=Pseudomonas idahonensis TaxID=2942628 RepID=A0ABT5Q3E8_9PSED|nr:AAA family ATPase [Pseudomonas idahonensis]MDD1148663.1 ATP-binding protein [Pseudomonas idahonensis]